MTKSKVIFSSLNESIDGLHEQNVEINNICHDIIGELGGKYLFYAMYRENFKSDSHVVTNCPIEWTDSYSGNDLHTVDPVFKRIMQGAAICQWNELQDLSDSEAKFMAQARQMLGAHGVTIALGTRPWVGAISLSSDCSAEEWAKNLPRVLWRLSTIGQKLHSITLSIDKNKRDEGKLSEKQRQYLALLASGCSIDTISKLASTNKTTVQRHLDHCQSRLQAANLAQAVAKAVSLGEIHL